MAKQVIVIGAGQGGLSAAVHARLRGYDVLVLEQQECSGGKAAAIVDRGYRLDPGPSIVILPSLYEDVFRDANRAMGPYLRFRRLDPIARVFMEGEPPVDLPADTEACLDVLASVAPSDAVAVRRLLNALDSARPHVEKSVFAHPYHKPIQLVDPHLIAMGASFDLRLTYRELVDKWFRSPLLRAFFYGFPSYGGQTYDSKAPGALMIPYFMIRHGVFYPEGGVAAIPKAFEALARDLGVEFRFGCRVCGIDVTGHKVRAVRTDRGDSYAADAVICNVDRLTARAWLGDPQDLEPSFSYYTVHWGLTRRLSGLSHHNLCIPARFEEGFEELYRRRRFPASPVVYLNETTGLDRETAPAGHGNLFSVVTSPAMEPSIDWESESAEYRGRTLETMRRCGVEVPPGDMAFERIQTPVTFCRRDGSYKGSLYGADERYRLFGLFPPRVVDEQYRNLFYCGGSVQPGAGLPMVTLSGKFAASMLS